VGPDGEPTHISQSGLDYSGMRLEDFKHLCWEAFLHPDDFPETVKAFEHAIQTRTSYEAVHRLRRAADGEYRWHHAHAEPLRDREVRIVQWYGLSVDIDEGKKVEDRLRRSEAYLAETEKLSRTGGWAVNRKGEKTIVYWSEEVTAFMGSIRCRVCRPPTGFGNRSVRTITRRSGAPSVAILAVIRLRRARSLPGRSSACLATPSHPPSTHHALPRSGDRMRAEIVRPLWTKRRRRLHVSKPKEQ
jgi:PAS domain S-box-containing protein